MASINTSLSTEHFLCSICLEFFTEPVSTPCGHNYCKGCIRTYWTTNTVSDCPLCKEIFHGAPELRVNTEFRDMLELFNEAFVVDDESTTSPITVEVPCDLCPGTACPAVKSCLVCLASYCSVHLEPHRTAQAFKWHQLTGPIISLKNRLCKKHKRIREYFCQDDQSCVCSVCLTDDHMLHKAVSVQEEYEKKKDELRDLKKQVEDVLTEEVTMEDTIKQSVVKSREKMERTKRETSRVFDALVTLIELRKGKLIDSLEEKQKAAEQKAEAQLRQLRSDIDEHKELMAKLEELSNTEDNFKVLQEFPSVPGLLNTDYSVVHHIQSPLNLDTLRSLMSKMKDKLNEEMDDVMSEIACADKANSEDQTRPPKKAFSDELEKIKKSCAVKVTLDPYTAHPCLLVSENGRKVCDVGRKRKISNNSTRFDFFHFVFAKEGFSSGRFYFEVTLKEQRDWEIGVARESISKKGLNLSLSPENGCWTLGSYWGFCQANANPPVSLSLQKEPESIGVFVDYDEGMVSFYDVDTRALIYSFVRCAFTVSEPHERHSSKRPYIGTPAKMMIYPMFRPSSKAGSGHLEIAPLI
ncbi:E3 ubiquitin-protein ligase TRIM39-like [Nelusetta ayraudi]|uniref:E3 ubiquitin-protein ligase TRIM39-like n=1 Tax=Nelusetta ayraudi TaxID=303726 RepID=UPI003F71F915